ILKEISPAIKEEIVRYSMIRGNTRTKKDYIAGREARISLPIVIKDGYNTIHITTGHVTHRDLHIIGVPGDEASVSIEIEKIDSVDLFCFLEDLEKKYAIYVDGIEINAVDSNSIKVKRLMVGRI
ncbi:MAG: hypothetical protein J6P43_09275, partial [Succinivibrionaceae bacterium]|nr:hypothetical protein [Succinivibrionaceae bacterium]